MARSCDVFAGFLSLVFFVFGFFALAQSCGGTACEKYFYNPSLVTISFFTGLCCLGGISLCRKSDRLQDLHLIVILVSALCFSSISVFEVVAISKGAGNGVPGLGFKEYKLGDNSNWLKKRFVNNDKNWNDIRSCMIDPKVCSSLLERNANKTAADFFKSKLSPIESGCCKPPIACGFQYQNATFWIAPSSGPAVPEDSDCFAWSNQQDKLCINCNSCKAGVLMNIKSESKFWVVFCLCLYMFNVIMCCAFINVKMIEEELHRQRSALHRPSLNQIHSQPSTL